MKRLLRVLGFAIFSMFTFLDSATPSVYPPIYIVVKNMPYLEAQLQKYAPQGYDCGYVIKDPYGLFMYGIFLVKDGGKYNLVYKNAGKIATKSIQKELADKLAASAKTNLNNASVPYTATENNDGDIWVEIYDGFYAYALNPYKIAECKTGEFTDIPDKAWMDEVKKIIESLENPKEDEADILVCGDETVYMPDPDVFMDQDGVYLVVPEMPEYPGGSAALLSSFRETRVYPDDAKAAGIQGRVLVQFIVEEDGSITNPEIVKSVYPSLDAEAVRFILAMPKWNPGKINGNPCRVKFTVPLNFRLN